MSWLASHSNSQRHLRLDNSKKVVLRPLVFCHPTKAQLHFMPHAVLDATLHRIHGSLEPGRPAVCTKLQFLVLTALPNAGRALACH